MRHGGDKLVALRHLLANARMHLVPAALARASLEPAVVQRQPLAHADQPVSGGKTIAKDAAVFMITEPKPATTPEQLENEHFNSSAWGCKNWAPNITAAEQLSSAPRFFCAGQRAMPIEIAAKAAHTGARKTGSWVFQKPCKG